VTAETLVSLREVGAALGLDAADLAVEARRLGVQVLPDWSGSPAVTVGEARGLVDGSLARQAAHDEAWRDHQADCEAWVQGRLDAAREAAQKVRERAEWRSSRDMFGVFSAPSSSEVAGDARDASHAAVVEYEKTVPRPLFQGATTFPLSFIDEADAPKPQRSVSARKRGAAA
jgi:hypothetical protein